MITLPLLLLGLIFILMNPFLLLPLGVFFLFFRFFKNRFHVNFKENLMTNHTKHGKLVYPKIAVRSFNEKTFNVNFKVSVSRCIATYSNSLGRYIILGAVVFRKIRDEALLRELILNIPVDYSFSLIKGNNGPGDTYLICLRVKASFYDYEDKVSMTIGVLNSLATTIPADEVKILEDRDLLFSILNVNLSDSLWRN